MPNPKETESNMKRYLCALMMVALAGCKTDSGPTAPTSTENQLPTIQPTGGSGSGGTSGANGPTNEGLTLDQCGMHPSWQGVHEEVDGLKVTITVPYEGASLILYVWLPEVNTGDRRGPFPFVDGTATAVFYVTEYRTYRYQLAVEQDLDGDGRADRGCQDDRHHGDFETRRPNIPPPPPPPPQSCNDRLRLSTEVHESYVSAVLREGQNAVASKTFSRIFGQAYTGSICEGELSDLLALSENDRCCFPVEVPGIECGEGTVQVEGQCIPYCEVNPNDEQCRPPAPECDFGDPTWNGQSHEWECPAPPPQCEIEGLGSLLASDERCVPPPQCEFGNAYLDDGLNWLCPDPPPEEHGQCFYEVAGNDKEEDCLAAGGTFSEHDGSDHCVFDFPGISQDGFNLNPGISDPDCLRKQDQDQD